MGRFTPALHWLGRVRGRAIDEVGVESCDRWLPRVAAWDVAPALGSLVQPTGSRSRGPLTILSGSAAWVQAKGFAVWSQAVMADPCAQTPSAGPNWRR